MSIESMKTGELRVTVCINEPSEVNDFMYEIITNLVPQVEDFDPKDGEVIFLWKDGDMYNPNRLLTLKARLQEVLDYWYDGEDFAITCPSCEHKGKYHSWTDDDGLPLAENELDEYEKSITCSNCNTSYTIGSLLYDEKDPVEDVEEEEDNADGRTIGWSTKEEEEE